MAPQYYSSVEIPDVPAQPIPPQPSPLLHLLVVALCLGLWVIGVRELQRLCMVHGPSIAQSILVSHPVQGSSKTIDVSAVMPQRPEVPVPRVTEVLPPLDYLDDTAEDNREQGNGPQLASWAAPVTFGAMAIAGPAAAASGVVDFFNTFGGPLLSLLELVFLVRLVLAWLPEINEKKMPWLVLYYPTEIMCRPIRTFLPPLFGVDSAPIFWVMILSLANELLFSGKEGLMTMIAQQEMGM